MDIKENKTIVLGVSGGIAAYKSAMLCSSLKKHNFNVHVIMTENAKHFVGELTFQTLSQNPVVSSLWDNKDWHPEHVALADVADIFCIVPATANIIAKLAHGIADDALSTFGATFAGKTIIAPAMNPKMWQHVACQNNIATLKQRNVKIVSPEFGSVACGKDGVGRLAEIDTILNEILETI